MSAFTHHLAYDFKTGIRDRSKLLMFYLFPLVFFFLVGGFMTRLNPGFRNTMIPGMTLFAFMSSVLLSLPNGLVQARESGVFRSYRVNGVPASSILAAPVLSTLLHMAVVTLVISLTGARLYAGVAPASRIGFVAAALLAFLTFAGLGVLIGVAAGSTNFSILVSQLLYIPSILLGGIMVPSQAMPEVFRRIGLLLPASHIMRLFDSLAYGRGPLPAGSLAVLGSSIALSFWLAARLFQWDSRAAQPGRKTWLALLALGPYLAAAAVGR